MPDVGLGRGMACSSWFSSCSSASRSASSCASFSLRSKRGEIVGLQMAWGLRPSSTRKALARRWCSRGFQYSGDPGVPGGECPSAAARRAGRQLPEPACQHPAAFGCRFFNVAAFGSTVFAVGLQLALPLIAILLMTTCRSASSRARAPAQHLCDRLSHHPRRGPDRAGFNPALLRPQLEQLIQNGLKESGMVIQALRRVSGSIKKRAARNPAT